MNWVKKINRGFVRIILFFIYIVGIGISFIVRKVLHKKDKIQSSYWKNNELVVLDEVNQEGY